MSKTDIDLWKSPVECDLTPPWGVIPIPDWVMNDFPSCIDEYTYPDPTIHTRVSVDPPDLNWYDCFCLTFNKVPGTGQFSMLSCGSTTGKCTSVSTDGYAMTDNSKVWPLNSLVGSAIINNTRGISGIVVWNDVSILKSTADGTLNTGYQSWSVGDSYEMAAPGSLTFTIDKTEGTDCCAQSYDYAFDFTLPCLPHNLTAATKLWYKYVVNCTKYHTEPGKEGTQYTQQECDNDWESTYKSMCSQDTVKFTEAGRFTNVGQVASSIDIGDAVTIVKPSTFASSKLFNRFTGVIPFTDTKPVTRFTTDIQTRSVSNETSFDMLGDAGFPKPVPFEIARLYPEPDSIISSTSLDVLITLRFDIVGTDLDTLLGTGTFKVEAYFSDTPSDIYGCTLISPVSDTLSHYRFYHLNRRGTNDAPVIASGQSRTLVVLAYLDKGGGKTYSSRIDAVYNGELPTPVIFNQVELTGSVFACELNSGVDKVYLIDSTATPVSIPCERITHTNIWFTPDDSYTLPVYFKASKVGAVYISDTVTEESTTASIVATPLQQIPNGTSNVVHGEFVQVMGYAGYRIDPNDPAEELLSLLTNVTLARTGSAVNAAHATYTVNTSYKIYVFVSDDMSAASKFFNTDLTGVDSIVLSNPGKITVSHISDTATLDGYFNDRLIELYSNSVLLGRYTIVSSTYSNPDWTFTVPSVTEWDAWTTLTVKIGPAQSFPATITKTFNGVTLTDTLNLTYSPLAQLPAQSYADFDSDASRLYSVYPLVAVELSISTIRTNNPVTELVLMCPEATEVYLSAGTSSSTVITDLQALPVGMDQKFTGLYTGKIEIPYTDGAYTTPYYVINIKLGPSFTFSQKIQVVKDNDSTYPYKDGISIDLQYPIKVGADYISRDSNLNISRTTYGQSDGLTFYSTVAEINLNGQSLPVYNTPPGVTTHPYILIVGTTVDLHITPASDDTFLTTWSDPLAGSNKYTGKTLIFSIGTLYYSRVILGSTACTLSGDPYLQLTLESSIPFTPGNISSFMIFDSYLLSLQDTHVPIGDGKLYQRRVCTPDIVGSGPQAPDASTGDRLTFVWPEAYSSIPWLKDQPNMRDVKPAVSTYGFRITGQSLSPDHRDQVGVVVDLQFDYPSNLVENEWQYKTLTIKRVEPVEAFEEMGTYQILSHTLYNTSGGTTLTLWLNVSTLTLPLLGSNVCVGVVGITNVFTQYSMTLCGLMPPDGSGASITYKVIGSSGIPWDSPNAQVIFTLDSKSFPTSVLGDEPAVPTWSYASLEISADVVGVSADGIEVPFDNRWGLPMLADTATGPWPILSTWALPGECEEFYITREQTTQALADETASYVDCGGECEFDITLNGASFKCDFGFKVIGRSVNIAGCGGGGMFHDMYISCPWNKHVHCDRPTAPCNCVFVLSYLLVIPLGSVLL